MQDRAFYNENGYILYKSLYSREELNNYVLDIHAVFKNRMQSLGFKWQEEKNGLIAVESLVGFYRENSEGYIDCMKQAQNLFHTFHLSFKPEIAEVLKVLGIVLPAFSTKPILMINNAATAKSYAHYKTPAHQDWRSIQGSLNGIIIWTALRDVCEEGIGPLEIIPGSHKWGLLKTEKDEWYRKIVDERVNDDAFLSIPMEQGDTLFFSAFLVHRSGTHNGSALPRYSLQFRYNDAGDSMFAGRGFPSTYPSDVPEIDYLENENNSFEAELAKVFGT